MRAITLFAKLQDEKVAHDILVKVILEANKGDEDSLTVGKFSVAIDTNKHCYSRPSNPYFFISYGFKIHFLPNFLPDFLHTLLI